MATIILTGYYGKQNVGDDAMLAACLREFHSQLPASTELSVLTCDPVWCASHIPVTYPKPRRYLHRTRAMLDADAVVFGGGGVFQDHRKTGIEDLRDKRRKIRMLRTLKRRILFVGVSLGPLDTSTGRRLASDILSQADFVSVRDEPSIELAQELGVSDVMQHFDLASLLFSEWPQPESQSSTVHKIVVGLSLVPAEYSSIHGNDEEVIAEAVSIVQHVLSVEGARIRLFVFSSRDDAALTAEVASQIPDSDRVDVVPYCSNPVAIVQQMACCTHFIGMRLHACVLAYMLGLPFVMVNYHPKCAGFHQSVGLADDTIVHTGCPDELLEKTSTLLSGASTRPKLDCVEAINSARRGVKEAVQVVSRDW